MSWVLLAIRYQQLRTDLQRHVAAHIYFFLHLRLRLQAQKHPKAEQKQEIQEPKIVISPGVLGWMGDSGVLTEWLHAGHGMGTKGHTGRVTQGADSLAQTLRPTDICCTNTALGAPPGGGITEAGLQRMDRESDKTCH